MRRTLPALTALAVLATACGGGPTAGPSPTPVTAAELVAVVASYDLAVGTDQRLQVGLFTPAQELIGFGTASFRLAYLGEDGGATPRVSPAVTATFLPVPGRDEPQGPTDRPRPVGFGEGAGVYVARVDLDQPGVWAVEVTVELDGEARRAVANFLVAPEHEVPAVGDPAPRTRNLTIDDTDAPPAAIDSRAATEGTIPDPELHRTTVADALAAGHPVVLVIATPVYCVSRFCGPITDVVQELAGRYSDRADFIHIEVWRDFEQRQLNDAAAEWIQTESGGNEPWTFLIGGDGTILARWDNVLDVAELEAMLTELPPLGS